MSLDQRTVLYDRHVALGGKMISFSGWEMPVQYTGILEEHEAVRTIAGMFDVSHMGEVLVTGVGATDFVQWLFTNDISSLSDGQVQYGMMCYENGTVVDDLLVYKYNEEHYLLVINAGNIDKDVAWINQQSATFEVEIQNKSHEMAEVAIQGPKAENILQRLTSFPLEHIGFFNFSENITVADNAFIISRTGYTGEDGFELYGAPEAIAKLWDRLIEVGTPEGLLPCGLGCRDTLRFEASLPLYGHELSDTITPLEAGLGMFVKLDKTDFIGKAALVNQKAEGLKRKIVGIELEKGIPRNGYPIYSGDKEIGLITTGYLSPTLKTNIGLALIDSAYSALGTTFEVQIRKNRHMATVVSKRFYQKKYKK